MKALSILIPVFNWDSSQLIKDLHFQGLELGIPYEIIITDDCSTDRLVMERNREQAVSLENCRFFALEDISESVFFRRFFYEQAGFLIRKYLSG